jgi:hypothetical protein
MGNAHKRIEMWQKAGLEQGVDDKRNAGSTLETWDV